MSYITIGFKLGIGFGMAYISLIAFGFILQEIVRFFRIRQLRKLEKKQPPKDMIFG